MNKREAETLVETVLTQPYAEADVRKLVVNIFPDLEPKSDRWTGAYVPEAFRGGVAQYGRLGKVEDAEGYTIDILTVKLKNAATLERARTLQRNFVARYLNGGRGGELRDAALVAFYADGTDDWRFSLVRMDYTLDPEKNKVRKELTPARRYSFLVGGDEKTHTAQKQLATLLQGGAETTLGELERAFNIESVTKEFFERYKALFLNLKEELDALERNDPRIRQEFADKTIDTATFAKRLLGQIVFLYFLQKKGWLGVKRGDDWGTGPKDFLQQLFKGDIISYRSFFDDILEPLFYDALAREHDDNFVPHFNRRAPFLNGGLFEAIGGYDWVNVDIPLKNELFTDIFNTFDLYNFTVREDEPLDKEVAVDPEMLGKVFENLLDVTDRKSKGAFYTPREIVHYMCQESLINYLDTALNTVTRPMAPQTPTQDDLFGRPQTRQVPLTEDVYEERVPRADLEAFIRLGDAAQEHDVTTTQKGKETDAYRFRTPESVRRSAGAIDAALADIKICDPAIGSGAFPVGMMNEIVRTRLALNAHISAPERSAYDFKRHAIQESIYGVDIEESAVDIAKLRLWLSLIVDEDDFGTIKPLPNLEYKIVIGNSLLGVEETLFNNEAFETLARLQHDYIGETRPGQKRDLKNRIDALIGELTNDSERFDFKIYFSEVFRQKGGFDVVIANPPYIGERNNTHLFSPIKQGSFGKFYIGRMDYFYFFFHLAIEATREKGLLAFITTNYFVTATAGNKLRDDLYKRTNIKELINFNELKIFDSAKGQHNLITIASKAEQQGDVQITVVKQVGTVKLGELAKILQKENAETICQKQSKSRLYEGEYRYIRFPSPTDGIFNRMQEEAAYLGDICEVKIGLKTALDKVFVLSGKEIEALSLSEKEKRLVKPFFKNSDVKRYSLKTKTQRYVLYLHEEIKNIRNHPTIWQYLTEHKSAIQGRRDANLRGAYKRGNWWVLSTPRLEIDFETSKIVTPYRTTKSSFALSDGAWYASADVYFIVPKDSRYPLKYLLGLLNSKLYFLWMYHKGKRKGNTLELYQRPLSEIPIRTINFSDRADKQNHDAVVGLVGTMLSLHEQKAAADPSERARLEGEIAATDAQIDALVYGLYELSEEEIRIVEEAVAR